MQNLTFEVGEVRRLEFTVSAQTPSDAIVITDARWALKTRSGDLVTDDVCTVEGTKISMLIPFEVKGYFTIEVTVTIPPEIIIEVLSVAVM